MSPSSPSPASLSALIFYCGETESDDPHEGELREGPSNHHQQSGDSSEKKPNVYVELFEEMLRTLVETEAHLFNLQEFNYISRYAALSPSAKFLMTKLLLRKSDTWHRLDSLKFEAEIGSTEAIVQAINEICAVPGQVKVDSQVCHPPAPQMAPPVPSNIKTEDVSISLDAVLSAANSIAGPSSIKLEDTSMDDAKPDTNHVHTFPELAVSLAEDESDMDLPALLECLRVDELRSIVKQMHVVKAGSKKPDMINALLRSSCTQATLFDFATTKSKMKSTPKRTTSTIVSSAAVFRQSALSFGRQTAQKRLRELALRVVGKCVRVHEVYHRFVRRANVIYFRLTQPSTLLLPALLSRFKKRSYASVAPTRTRDIWPSREALFAYEEALEQESLIDAALAGDFAAVGAKREFKTPATDGLQSKIPVTPSTGSGVLQTPISMKTVQTPSSAKIDSVRVRGARIAKEIFEEVFPHWQALVKVKSEDDCAEKARGCGLERFESGYILTRLVCKGAHSLGILGEHDYELRVLEALLAQRRWRRGRRGMWYERRALILEKYAVRDDEMKWAENALVACVEALEDDDTHIVYRPKLERRLTTLEKKLNLDPADRHTSEGRLLHPVSVSFEGVRVCHRAASLKLDRTGRNTCTPGKPGTSNAHAVITRFWSPVKHDAAKVDETPASEEKGKSIWIGRDNLEVNVETLALQWYEDRGFKGIHSETRIITTLFGILFWDIIFLLVPGAFETRFQTAPLDIAEDAFYHARRDAIETRLKELEDGRGEDIAKRIEAEHRAHKTWCIGVDWTLLEEGEIVDIVRCLGGKALSVICRLLCEDYAGRRSGGPDLFLWNADSGDCKFVEVKGPGDNLQENQKIWIDVLLRAQAAVEVCWVFEQGKGDVPKAGKKRKSKGSTNKRRIKAKNAIESDTEEEEMQPICESEDDADALPVIAPRILHFMEEAQGDTIDPSTPSPSSKKRKLITEVVISTPSPRKRVKISRRSSSPKV
ncbi:hypothetical protein M405DRAFT_918147 [Rhizopogon salebrosus TDB-379]|nr:hypothetical protein M405DRAFT_918147 [Rhizopogon salebrosus TDB-379]